MKLYIDHRLTEEITEYNPIKFGVVRAGTDKEKKIYLYNDSDAVLTNIEISFLKKVDNMVELDEKLEPKKYTEKDITVIFQEEEIKPHSTGLIVLKWGPSFNLKKPLDIFISVKVDELYI